MIEVDGLNPPVGHLRPLGQADAPPQDFQGWLGLLHALSAAFDEAGAGSERIPDVGDVGDRSEAEA